MVKGRLPEINNKLELQVSQKWTNHVFFSNTSDLTDSLITWIIRLATTNYKNIISNKYSNINKFPIKLPEILAAYQKKWNNAIWMQIFSILQSESIHKTMSFNSIFIFTIIY